LGFFLSKVSLCMDPKKTLTVCDWPQPSSVKEVQRMLGCANFYRKFIRGFNSVVAPLTNLTKSDRVLLSGLMRLSRLFKHIR